MVVFTGASNLAAGGPFDLYEHNLQTGETIGLNLFPNGTRGEPEWFALNNNAQLIAFVNISIDVFPGDTNKRGDVFVHNRGNSITKKSGNTDLNGDGNEDLVWRNVNSGVVAAWFLAGTSIGSTAFLAGVPLEWQIAGIGDVNGDGLADVIWRHMVDGVVAIWLMNGNSIASVVFPGAAPLVWIIEGVGDLDGTGPTDLLWRNSLTGEVVVWLMNGGAIVATGSLGIVPKDILIKGVGDTNSDGKADVIRYNTTTGEVTVWQMDGTTISATIVAGMVSTDWEIQGVGDFDGDGQLDILWQNVNSGIVAGWLLKNGILDSSAFFGGVSSDWQIAQVGDADGDSKADVIWYNTLSGSVACWLLNGLTIGSVAFPGSVSTDWVIAGKPLVPTSPPVIITTGTTLPVGTVGQAYNGTLGASGGTPPLTWSVFAGSLPPGLTLNSSTGQLSGTPTAAGDFLASIRVQDSAIPPQAAQELFSLTINAPSPTTGGGGGTLTVSNAPASVGGTFVADEAGDTRIQGNDIAVVWGENIALGNLSEFVSVGFTSNNQIGGAFFQKVEQNQILTWQCLEVPPLLSQCVGASLNRSAGTLTFVNTVLNDVQTSQPPITLNGTLTFPPF